MKKLERAHRDNQKATTYKVVEDLLRVKQKYPNMRLGQILVNVVSGYEDLYYIADQDLSKLLSEFNPLDVPTEKEKE